MKQYFNNPQDSESSSQIMAIRQGALSKQQWNRNKSARLALEEDIILSDEHWDVIQFLRSYYLEFGLPRYARTTARALNKKFADRGGSKYLHVLFTGGPVTQGSRLANLPTPSYATDVSFGSTY
jgi:tRNA 2-thiouridine synthesizing protein E